MSRPRPRSTAELVPRGECLASNPYLAHEVVGWQRAHALDEDPPQWLEEGCDAVQPDPGLRVAACLVLYAPAERFDDAAEGLGPALARMLEPFGGGTLTFLHALRSGRWPTRRRRPPVLAEAGRAFRAMGAGNGFDGGIRTDARAAAAVVTPLMWIVRMDMGYGLVFVAPDCAPFAASFCQYGNLHVDVYDAAAVPAIRASAHSAGLEEWIQGICDERFSGAAIPGRALSMGRGG